MPHNESRSKRKKKMKLWSRSIDVLLLFPDGIPCLSQTLPKPVRELPQVKKRKTLFMIGYCKVQYTKCVKI